MTGLALLVLAAALLALGADLFVDHVGEFAAGLRTSSLAVGLLLAGAEPEELVTTVIASARDQTAIAAGDAVGANVTMLTLVLGVVLLLQPLEHSVRVRAYAVAAVVSSLLAAVCLTGGILSRPEGILLAVAYVGFIASVLVRERQRDVPIGARPLGGSSTTRRPVRSTGLAVLGLMLVTFGGWAAVSGAERIVTGLDLSGSGVGLTLVAFATSSELLALLWAARRHRVTEIAVAALVGSVVGNATATLGIATLVRPLEAPGVTTAAWAAAGLSMLLLVPLDASRRRAIVIGTLLTASYVAFVALALR
jgi:cation:H+ antiporter